jgi:hypothetical protein
MGQGPVDSADVITQQIDPDNMEEAVDIDLA